jgi:phenylalanyl-tRNA synthetase beta chain
MPMGPLPVHERHPLEMLRERIRDVLVGFGLRDTVSYSAIEPAWLTRLTPDGSCIAPEPLRITNPTTVAQSAMRPTLRASVFDTASRNLRYRAGVAIFEIAPVYLSRRQDLPEERWTIAILLAGQAEPPRENETWLVKERRYDLQDLRGIDSGLRESLHARPAGTFERGAPGLHPGQSLRREVGGRLVSLMGRVDPRVAALWNLPDETFIAEIDLAQLLAEIPARPVAVEPPRYPPAIRDLAVIVDESRPYGDVEQAIVESAKGLVESVALRDVYRGAQLGEGKKSFAVRIVLRSAAGTLAVEDVDKAMRRIQSRLERGLGAVLRS